MKLNQYLLIHVWNPRNYTMVNTSLYLDMYMMYNKMVKSEKQLKYQNHIHTRVCVCTFVDIPGDRNCP